MFDIFPKALGSLASFLFPLFASYKALNSADPAQLTPWLMYWVVLSCLVFVESWVDWLLVWVPFYHYARLFFLLYLVLPQTQGARVLYQTHLHPWLARHEARIDDFIGSAHDRLRDAGLHYCRQAVAYLRTLLGLPGLEREGPSQTTSASSPQGYTQALLARFTLPGARWPGGAAGAAAGGGGTGGSTTGGGGSNASGPSSADLYALLSSAVGALGTATGAAGGAAASAFSASSASRGPAAPAAAAAAATAPNNMTASDRASFLATQRDRLRTLLSALDREAAQLGEKPPQTAGCASGEPLSRPPSDASSGSSSGGGGLSKSRSEPDFEKIDAESGTEEERPAAGVRQRRPGAAASAAAAAASGAADGDPTSPAAGRGAQGRSASGSWMPWAWGGGGAAGSGQ